MIEIKRKEGINRFDCLCIFDVALCHGDLELGIELGNVALNICIEELEVINLIIRY